MTPQSTFKEIFIQVIQARNLFQKPYHSVKKIHEHLLHLRINRHLIYCNTKDSTWHSICSNSLPTPTTLTPSKNYHEIDRNFRSNPSDKTDLCIKTTCHKPVSSQEKPHQGISTDQEVMWVYMPSYILQTNNEYHPGNIQ